jgi:iron complex outermembrane receptor protein
VYAFYTGKRYAGFNNTKGQPQTYSRLFEVDGFSTLDLSTAYAYKQLSLLVKISNVLNVYSVYLHENYSVNPIPPRQVVATIAYKFKEAYTKEKTKP